MNRKISRKTIYLLISIFIFAIFVALGGMRAYFHSTRMQYFGEAVEVKEGNFVIKTNEGSEVLILTNQDTDIRKGRRTWTEPLKVGDFVIVVGPTNQEGLVEARVIRIVVPPHPQPSL